MATLQKFKLLATQCAVIGSPTRSPTTSPVIHIRRRKTLKMLLSGKSSSNHHHHHNNGAFNRRFIHHANTNRRGIDSSDRPKIADQKSTIEKENNNNSNNNHTNTNQNNIGVRSKLKDLFVSSPPPTNVPEEDEEERLLPVTGSSGGGTGSLVVARRGGVRPLSATLRQRLLMRRIWRPVLVAIPEQSP